MIITFKPWKPYIIVSYVIVGITILPFGLFAIFPELNIKFLFGILFITMVSGLIINFFFSTEYIFNLNRKELKRKRLGYGQKILNFSEIYKIEKMETGGNNNLISYSVIMKDDKFGHGYKLNLSTIENSKYGEILKEKITQINTHL
ncbi:hypothetical protein EZJ43_13220 [Pedobacter changchengzhani]|uniref:Uncharacterized protein n=1 Tax=Pedobacter changchengzhani TaxID=2529274 RepID=A0A4R5MIW6_9SPHI|nr:hypothetical protein [Pedobacter changchengzhani]TDG35577.1 hypothetical protein EZJ43_13220 [Pedobacter changchengzhani]